jgi:hypothetical protein
LIVKFLHTTLIVLLAASPAVADRVTIFGSAGAEGQHSPPNGRSPLNPGNFLSIPDHSGSADFALFVSVAPDAERWKIRTKLRGDATDSGDGNLEIAEASLQLQLNDAVDLTVGRVIERWGTGYGWTPTAFVGPERNPTDPSDRRSLSSGRDMLRLTGFAHETQMSLYLLDGGAAAVRAYRLIGGTDVSLALMRDGGERREGVSLSRVFGEALELHLEAAHGRTEEDERLLQIVLGGQVTWRRVNLVAELHHRSDGMSRQEWSSFRSVVDEARRSGDTATLLSANRLFVPLRMGNDYAFIRLAGSIPIIRVEAEVITLTNLRDASTIVRTALSRRLHPNLSLILMNTEFAGRSGSEISYIQVDRLTTAGIRLHF